jgi:hypothetical protein
MDIGEALRMDIGEALRFEVGALRGIYKVASQC